VRGVQVRLHLLLPAQMLFCRVCTVRVGWCVLHLFRHLGALLGCPSQMLFGRLSEIAASMDWHHG
jgi:hypothetical protein